MKVLKKQKWSRGQIDLEVNINTDVTKILKIYRKELLNLLIADRNNKNFGWFTCDGKFRDAEWQELERWRERVNAIERCLRLNKNEKKEHRKEIAGQLEHHIRNVLGKRRFRALFTKIHAGRNSVFPSSIIYHAKKDQTYHCGEANVMFLKRLYRPSPSFETPFIEW